jgi:hypothetical protein
MKQHARGGGGTRFVLPLQFFLRGVAKRDNNVHRGERGGKHEAQLHFVQRTENKTEHHPHQPHTSSFAAIMNRSRTGAKPEPQR